MYTIRRKQAFEYAHRLLGHPANCRFVHGHSGVAEAEIMSATLDDQGMVDDFGLLKEAMNVVLNQWDHAILLQEKDPLTSVLQLHEQRVYTFEEPPTAEVMARTLFNELQHAFPGRVKSVTVSETANNRATYYGATC